MSLIIKGMKLPKTGHVDITIDAKGKIYSKTPGIPFWNYAAVEIPTPHGRIIDEDAIRGRDMSNNKTSAPTILEAEE